MYLLRHFVFLMITLARCTVRLQFRFCLVWVWDLLIWLGDSLNLALRRERKVECDCCGWKGNRFFLQTLISGAHVHRSRELCPRCESLERQRQLVRYLRDRTRLLSLNAPTILDIGPSKAVVEWFRKHDLNNIVTVDLRPRVAALRMDITQLGFRASIFDVIVCSHVLEHVRDDLGAMREMLRVMKEGGIGIFQVPLQPDLLETVEYDEPRPEEHHHLRAYGQDFVSRLNFVGFEVRYAANELFEVTKPYNTAGQLP
jgi:SAM-dependent methyltransferase